jgi:prevent-host-death family protein
MTRKKTTYNVHEAKTNLSRLLQQVADGEEVIIAKAGEPVARLVPIPKQGQREMGFMRGKIWIADDFDAPLPDDLQKLFEGG